MCAVAEACGESEKAYRSHEGLLLLLFLAIAFLCLRSLTERIGHGIAIKITFVKVSVIAHHVFVHQLGRIHFSWCASGKEETIPREEEKDEPLPLNCEVLSTRE